MAPNLFFAFRPCAIRKQILFLYVVNAVNKRDQLPRSVQEETPSPSSIRYLSPPETLDNNRYVYLVFELTCIIESSRLTGQFIHCRSIHHSSPNRRTFTIILYFAAKMSGVIRSFRITDVFEDNTDEINSTDFSSNGRHFITSSEDNTIAMYDCIQSEMTNVFENQEQGTRNVKFARSNAYAVHSVTRGQDHSIKYVVTRTLPE